MKGTMPLFYYKNLEAASRFYESIGLERKVNLDWWKVYSVTDEAHIGLIGGNIVPEDIESKKAVKLLIMVEDVDHWFTKIKKLGIKTDKDEVYTSSRLNLREFSFKDEGYTIEFCQFLTPFGV